MFHLHVSGMHNYLTNLDVEMEDFILYCICPLNSFVYVDHMMNWWMCIDIMHDYLMIHGMDDIGSVWCRWKWVVIPLDDCEWKGIGVGDVKMAKTKQIFEVSGILWLIEALLMLIAVSDSKNKKIQPKLTDVDLIALRSDQGWARG